MHKLLKINIFGTHIQGCEVELILKGENIFLVQNGHLTNLDHIASVNKNEITVQLNAQDVSDAPTYLPNPLTSVEEKFFENDPLSFLLEGSPFLCEKQWKL